MTEHWPATISGPIKKNKIIFFSPILPLSITHSQYFTLSLSLYLLFSFSFSLFLILSLSHSLSPYYVPRMSSRLCLTIKVIKQVLAAIIALIISANFVKIDHWTSAFITRGERQITLLTVFNAFGPSYTSDEPLRYWQYAQKINQNSLFDIYCCWKK